MPLERYERVLGRKEKAKKERRGAWEGSQNDTRQYCEYVEQSMFNEMGILRDAHSVCMCIQVASNLSIGLGKSTCTQPNLVAFCVCKRLSVNIK